MAAPAFNDGGPVTEWFDTSAFAMPAPFHFGTSAIRPAFAAAPPTSLFKDIPLTKRFRLQLRGEFFNLFHKPQFAPPGSLTVGTPSFGRLSALAHDPGEIQFALKLHF